MRTAIYIRWSTDEQGEGTTLEVQRGACLAFAQSQGWTVAPDLLFLDEGVSGATLQRPGLTRLRAAIQAGLVDCVLVYKLDRLSRSVVDMVRLVLDEWEGRCHLKSAREPIDTLTQAGRLFFYQLMAFAEWERNVIRERTFAGKLRRAQEGRNPGICAAYGYRLGPNGLPVVCPEEAPVVAQLFAWYLGGLGCTQIARHLNALGQPAPAGGCWSSGQVARMLANPLYCGTLVYGKQTTVRGRRVKADQPHLVREGAVPALVDAETFAAVQRLRAGRPGPGRSPATGSGRALSGGSLLTGLLRCTRCGGAYRSRAGGGGRAQYRYYCCGKPGCSPGGFRQTDLDGVVATALQEHHAPDGSRLEAACARDQAATAATERERTRLTARRRRLETLLLDGEITPAEYKALRADLAEREALLAQRPAPRPPAEVAVVSDPWAILTPAEQKRLLRHFVTEVSAVRDPEAAELHLTITWRSGR